MRKIYIAILSILFSAQIIIAQKQFWEKVDGIYGGMMYSIVNNENILYSGGNGGIYQSTNEGENWINIGLREETITKIVITSENIFAISKNGCFRTLLGDTSWSNIFPGRWQSMYAKDSLVFVGSDYEGIYRSTDYGETWLESNDGINNYDIEEIFITSNSIILAAAAGTSGSGVFRSTNHGKSWYRIDEYQFAWNFEGITEFNSELYSFDFTNSAKVFKSTDFGESWFLPEGASAPKDIIQSIYVDNSALYVGVYHYGIYKSIDEGRSWTQINNGLVNKDAHSILATETDLYLATFEGIFKSNKNNIQWVKKNKGVNSCWVTALDRLNNNLFIGTYGSGVFQKKNTVIQNQSVNLKYNYINDLFIHHNIIYAIATDWSSGWYANLYYSGIGSSYWSNLTSNLSVGVMRSVTANDLFIYLATHNGVYRRSTSGGNWEKLSNGIPENINASDIECNGSVVMISNGTSNIFISTDNGDTWTEKYVDRFLNGSTIYHDNEDNFYVGSKQISNVFVTSNAGENWQSLGHPKTNNNIQTIFKDNDEIFIGHSSNGVLSKYSEDNNWEWMNLGLENKNITSFSKYKGNVYCGTRNNGIYKRIIDETELYPIVVIDNYEVTFRWKSSNGISTYRFQLASDSLFSNILYDINNIQDTSIKLDYFDHGKQYYWRVSSITKYWSDNFTPFQLFELGKPIKYYLHQNYPNPFNNSTRLRYEVPLHSNVKLSLYNNIGQEVKVLVNKELSAGTHYYDFQTFDIASGVYFISLISGDVKQTIKIILIK